jgi:hypothetical protein
MNNLLSLEDLNVAEISKEDAASVDGGGLFAIILGAVLVVATVADAIWDIESLDTPADWFRK